MTGNNNVHAAQSRRLPDDAICRKRAIDPMHGICECLVERPVDCEYALSYGDSYLCRLPLPGDATVMPAKYMDEPITVRRPDCIDEPITIRRADHKPALCKPAPIPAALRSKTASAKLEAVLVALGVPLPPSAVPIDLDLADYAERLARGLGLAKAKHAPFAELVAVAARISVLQLTDALMEQRRTFGKLVDILAANGVITDDERNLIGGFRYRP